jgi:hypothetical protein
MATKESLASLEAKHGEKMIEVKVRFWTNDISREAGKVIPKPCVDIWRCSHRAQQGA